jgi:hypothetical protein
MRERVATMATLGVRSRSLTRSLAEWFRSTKRLDKLWVTGSSPVPPINSPAKRMHALPELLTDSVSQVLVK